jgi:hypothetical protein
MLPCEQNDTRLLPDVDDGDIGNDVHHSKRETLDWHGDHDNF